MLDLKIKIVVKLGIRHEWMFMLVVVSKWTATLLFDSFVIQFTTYSHALLLLQI